MKQLSFITRSTDDRFPLENPSLAEWKEISASNTLRELAVKRGLLPDPALQQEIDEIRFKQATPPRVLPDGL